jgi:DNA-binding PadR family transcriptional regulator
VGLRIRLSKQTLAILDALLVRPAQWHHGYAISKVTGIASGTLYPILMRLEKLGWLETRWEEARVPGRPPRHQYRLSPNGREWAAEELGAARETKFGKLAAREVHG